MNEMHLASIAAKIRLKIFESVLSAGKGHIGGALSCTDILVGLYFGLPLNISAQEPDNNQRDRFILSKGHASIALYSVLVEKGFIDEADLSSVCQKGSLLGEHADHFIPGVDLLSGSLGHGLAFATGIALGAKLNNQSFKSYVLMGDGECQEGSVWEAATKAPIFKLNNLVAIIDNNQQITLDYTNDCYETSNFRDKFTAFGWYVTEVDGHDYSQLLNAFNKDESDFGDRPHMIIANTVKGKGISFMENQLKWHHGMPSDEEKKIALSELRHSKVVTDE